VLHDLGESSEKSGGELGLGNETNTGGLKGAEGNVGEELSKSGGGKVDGGAVLLGGLVSLLTVRINA
jgi:hypothetical protein